MTVGFFLYLCTMKTKVILFLLMLSSSVIAQTQRIRDFIESTSYNLDKIGV